MTTENENIPPVSDDGDAAAAEAEVVAKAEYDALQAKLGQNEQMAKFGTGVFERLSVLRDSNPEAYRIVKAAMETGEMPEIQAKASESISDTVDDDMLGAIHQVVRQVMQNEVAPLRTEFTRMQMDAQIANLRAKYGEDAVAANHQDLIQAIDSNPGILKQPNGLETLFKAVDHEKVYDRMTSKKLEEEQKQQERLLRRRGLPAGNLGGRSPEPKLESFEDMWEYAKQQLQRGSLED